MENETGRALYNKMQAIGFILICKTSHSKHWQAHYYKYQCGVFKKIPFPVKVILKNATFYIFFTKWIVLFSIQLFKLFAKFENQLLQTTLFQSLILNIDLLTQCFLMKPRLTRPFTFSKSKKYACHYFKLNQKLSHLWCMLN